MARQRPQRPGQPLIADARRSPPSATVHSFPALIAPGARVLVLGSMPGVASLDAAQYYAHPRNQFWPIMASLLDFEPALDYPSRLRALTDARIALWDVMASCVRPGSLDADIQAASIVPNAIPALLAEHPSIVAILLNGGSAETAFRRHVLPNIQRSIQWQRLPSTSPAHAALGFDAKCHAWRAGLYPHMHPDR